VCFAGKKMFPFLGFRFMLSAVSYYEFVTIWNLDAPVEKVWEEIKDSGSWPEWWKGVIRVVELEAGDGDGVGAIHRSTWKSALPYTLEFDSEIVRIEKFKFMEARAFGELDGKGLWRFETVGNGKTRVQYDWQVNATKLWMRYLSPLARPLFRWNHDVIMGWGEKGLKKRLLDHA